MLKSLSCSSPSNVTRIIITFMSNESSIFKTRHLQKQFLFRNEEKLYMPFFWVGYDYCAVYVIADNDNLYYLQYMKNLLIRFF